MPVVHRPLRLLLAALLLGALVVGCAPPAGTDLPTTSAAATAMTTGADGSAVVPIGEDGAEASVGEFAVSIPAGTAPAGTDLIIETAVAKDAPVGELDDEDIELVTAVYDLSLSTGEQPAAPISITVPVPDDIDADADAEFLAAVTLNSETGLWEGIPVTVDDGVATFAMDHFSWFGVVIARPLWNGLMEFAQDALLEIDDPPECYGQTLTVDDVLYSASSSSALYHACVVETDEGGVALRIRNSGPYTWLLEADDGIALAAPAVRTPMTFLDPSYGQQAVTAISQAVYEASDGEAVQLPPASTVDLPLGDTAQTLEIDLDLALVLSSSHMLLQASIDLAMGQVVDTVGEALFDGYGWLTCIGGYAAATTDVGDADQLLECVGPALDLGLTSLDAKAARWVSLRLAIYTSFGPKIVQVITGLVAEARGDGTGTVEVSVIPVASSGATSRPAPDLTGIPAVAEFPGCGGTARCTIVDTFRVDHPTQGTLRLALVTRLERDAIALSDAGLDHAIAGALLVVDADGRITDLHGDSADDVWSGGAGSGSSDGPELDRVTWESWEYPGSTSPADLFQVHAAVSGRDGTDGTGGASIFLDSPGEMGTAAVTLSVEPAGYFTVAEVVSMYTSDSIDYATIPDDAAPPTDYFSVSWLGTDASGYPTLELVSHGDESASYETRTPLRREGGVWVYDG
ncbi:hypothetical protein ACXET9_15185 [Brachybacterium sp. DNPG3]